MPKWPEMSVAKMWKVAVQAVPDFLEYMPDDFNGDHRTERKFFWGVFYAKNSELVERLVEDCRHQRYPGLQAELLDNSNRVNIAPEWRELLKMGAPKFACKCLHIWFLIFFYRRLNQAQSAAFHSVQEAWEWCS